MRENGLAQVVSQIYLPHGRRGTVLLVAGAGSEPRGSHHSTKNLCPVHSNGLKMGLGIVEIVRLYYPIWREGRRVKHSEVCKSILY